MALIGILYTLNLLQCLSTGSVGSSAIDKCSLLCQWSAIKCLLKRSDCQQTNRAIGMLKKYHEYLEKKR